MATNALLAPGVYVSESLLPPSVTTTTTDSQAVFVGAHQRGPTVPTLVTSFLQFTSLYGGFVPNYMDDLLYAVYQFFLNGGSQCWVLRVLGGTEAVSTLSMNDREATPEPSMVITALNPGAWGNQTYIGIVDNGTGDFGGVPRFTITVYYVPLGASFIATTYANYAVETWANLSQVVSDPRYAPALINSQISGSNFITITDSTLSAGGVSSTFPLRTVADTIVTSVYQPAVLIGGSDDLAVPGTTPAPALFNTALSALSVVQSPIDLNLPGINDAVTINDALAYAVGRGDTFVVIDSITNAGGRAQNPSSSAEITAVAGYTATSYGAVYYPWIPILDPGSPVAQTTRICAPGGAILAACATTDDSVGPQQAPAGPGYNIATAQGLEVVVAVADAAALQSALPPVNAIRNLPNLGIVIFGARTMETSGQADKYVNVRRTLIYLESNLKLITQFALFQNNDTALWSDIESLVTTYLTNFWGNGGLAGDTAQQAFVVTCDSTNNTPTSVAMGIVNISVGVALLTPAEYINISVAQIQGTAQSIVTDSLAA